MYLDSNILSSYYLQQKSKNIFIREKVYSKIHSLIYKNRYGVENTIFTDLRSRYLNDNDYHLLLEEEKEKTYRHKQINNINLFIQLYMEPYEVNGLMIFNYHNRIININDLNIDIIPIIRMGKIENMKNI